MSLKAYQQFIAVAEEGAFGRAAQRLGIAQPALSQSIQRLERRLGVTLLERSGRGVRPTPAGEAFLPDARVAVAAAARADALAAAAAKPERRLRLGVITPALWGPMGEAVRLAEGLGLSLELVEGTTPELVDALAAGRIDVSFIAPRFEAPARMRRLAVADDPVVLAVPTAVLEAGQDPMAYAARRLILFPREYGPQFHDEALAMFPALGLTPTVIQTSPRMLTTLALISAGVGASVLVAPLARSIAVAGVTCRPLPPEVTAPRWAVQLGYMPPAALSPAAEFVAAWKARAPAA